MIDSHCHLDAKRFDEDRTQVLARAWAAGLTGIVVPAVGPADWETLLAYPVQDRRLQVGLGIHPQLLPQLPPEADADHLARLDALLSRGGAVAVGECGLDGPSAQGAPLPRQVAVLRAHLALARKHQLPALVHCHHAHPLLIELLQSEPLPPAGLLLHSYSGGPELAKFYLRKGCFFSFAGPITWPEARKPKSALREVPLERLLLETDAPDQAPYPHRGQRSEPGYLPLMVAAAAEALGVPADEVAARTRDNARTLFRGAFEVK